MSRANTKNTQLASQLNDVQLAKVASQFRLLGEPLRLKILQALCLRPMSVTEIVDTTGATQSNISKHLALLSAAGIIVREKNAQFVYYSLGSPLTLKLCQLVHKELLP